MDLVDTRKSRCQRCGILPQKVFNPIAGCMTTKSTTPRSPSEFLCEDTTARELWEHVQAAGAYEHHRREGDTHYIGFVDTQKLLETSRIGKTLVEKLASVVSNSGNRPSVLLAPRRARARLLARKMCRALEAATGIRPRILEATQKRSTGRWELSAANFGELFHADVLIVDTAAGHGRTIDQLASLAARATARRIGGAVLLSRLSPPCEDAFNLRLSGGYHRLFHLPIRPVAIRGDRVDLCPVCRHKDAIRRFAEESDIDGLEEWADSLLKARRGAVEPSPRGEQHSRYSSGRIFCRGAAPRWRAE